MNHRRVGEPTLHNKDKTMKNQITKALETINRLHGVRRSKEEQQENNAAWSVIQKNMQEMAVDIDAAEWDITPRYCLLEAAIPINKRGNLSKFAGRQVYVVNTTISRRGARINFYIMQNNEI